MNKEKLQAAVEEAFADEPKDGYRPFVIAVYSLREGQNRLGLDPTGTLEVFLRRSVPHGHMLVFDAGKSLFQWLKDQIPRHTEIR
jgi:hypothetical protein